MNITATISILLSVIAVFISAISAYYTHFNKKIELFVHAYDKILQEDVDSIVVFTNGGNVSLVIPWIQIASTNSSKSKRTVISAKPVISAREDKERPMMQARKQDQVIKPGEHLELLVNYPSGLNKEHLLIQFETITGTGDRYYCEETLSTPMGLALTPSLLKLNDPPLFSGAKQIHLRTWNKRRIDGYERK